jgi:hypothetical protein
VPQHKKGPSVLSRPGWIFLSVDSQFWLPCQAPTRGISGCPQELLDPARPIMVHFTKLKEALLRVPAPGLLNHSWPFFLYLYTNQNITLGLLSLGVVTHPDLLHTYQNNYTQLYKDAPFCLKTPGAAVLLTSETQKFTLNQHITILSPHDLQELTSHQALNPSSQPIHNSSTYTTAPVLSQISLSPFSDAGP